MSRLTIKSSAYAFGRVGLLTALLGAAVSAPVMAGDATASELTSCASEANPDKRLACYDHLAGRDHRGAAPVAAIPVSAAPVPASPAAAAPAPPAAHSEAPKHVAARVVSIERHADGFVLHLDNGQVWRHEDSTPTRADLQAGDPVTVERSLGSYWLSGRSGSALQVTQVREPASAP